MKSDPRTLRHVTTSRRLWIWVSALVLMTAAGVVVLLVWPSNSSEVRHAYALAPESVLPENLRKAPPKVQEAYRFAIANRELLTNVPCYCGCGAEHKSNAECYIKEVKSDGKIDFDLMSYG